MTPLVAKRSAAVFIASLVLVGACSPAQEPVPEPTSSSSSAAVEEPTEAPALAAPEKPAAMANDDEAGALAAVDYFLALYGYTQASGDTEPLAEFCHADSALCQNTLEEVAARTESGAVYTGGAVTWCGTPVATRMDDADPAAFHVTGDATQALAQITADDGSPIEETPESTIALDVIAYFDDGGWSVFEANATARTSTDS